MAGESGEASLVQVSPRLSTRDAGDVSCALEGVQQDV